MIKFLSQQEYPYSLERKSEFDLDKFKKWAKSSKNVIEIERSRFLLNEREYFRVGFALSISGKRYEGIGRDETFELALVKSFSEAVERYVYDNFFKPSFEKKIPIDPETFHPDYKGDPESTSFFQFFNTTNGWSAHPSLKESIKSSLGEIIERHLLILSFIKYGFAGFIEINSGNLGKYFVAKIQHSDTIAGFVVREDPLIDGQCFGYFCSAKNEKELENGITKANLEAFDALTVAKNLGARSNTVPHFVDTDRISRLGNYWLNNKIPQIPRISETEIVPGLKRLNVAAVDASPSLQLPFPYYVTFLTDSCALPLIVEPSEASLARERLDLILEKYGVVGFNWEQMKHFIL